MKISFATIALLTGSTQAAGDHCYALAMAGGGTKGAYEAGVLWGLYHAIPDKTKLAYDVVTGVSAGSINGAAVSLFAPGDENSMVKSLSETW